MTYLVVLMSTLLVTFLVMSTSANQRYGRPRAFENDRSFDLEDYDDYGVLTDQGMVKEQHEIATKSRPIQDLFDSPSIQTRWRRTTTKVPRKPITTTRKFTTRKPKTTTRKPITNTRKSTTRKSTTRKSTTKKVTTKKPKVVSTTKKPRYSGCGKSIHDDKIIGGQNVNQEGKFPWIVTLLRPGPPQFPDTWFPSCAGTIISDRHILTASHCLPKWYKPSDLMVRLGESSLNSTHVSASRRDVVVSAIFRHDEDTVFLSPTNDIAILQLKERIDWTEMIQPICLPTAGSPLNLEGRVATIAGMEDRTPSNYKESQFLMKVDLPIITLNQCEKLFCETPFAQSQFDFPIDEEHICTYDYPNGGKSPGREDSGGPLMFRMGHSKTWTVIGVISWDYGSMLPTIYARVSSYYDWIQSKMAIK